MESLVSSMAGKVVTTQLALSSQSTDFIIIVIVIIFCLQDWVYKQVCCCTTPLHPLVVPLLEAFVHAVINPVQNSKSSKNREASFTQRGFTDAEVMSAFAADQQVCEILV